MFAEAVWARSTPHLCLKPVRVIEKSEAASVGGQDASLPVPYDPASTDLPHRRRDSDGYDGQNQYADGVDQEVYQSELQRVFFTPITANPDQPIWQEPDIAHIGQRLKQRVAERNLEVVEGLCGTGEPITSDLILERANESVAAMQWQAGETLLVVNPGPTGGLVFPGLLQGLHVVVVEPNSSYMPYLWQRYGELRQAVEAKGGTLEVVEGDIKELDSRINLIIAKLRRKFDHIVCHDAIGLLDPIPAYSGLTARERILSALASYKNPDCGAISFSTVEYLLSPAVAEHNIFEGMLAILAQGGLVAQDMALVSVPQSLGIKRGIVLKFAPPELDEPKLSDRIREAGEEAMSCISNYETACQELLSKIPEGAGQPPSIEPVRQSAEGKGHTEALAAFDASTQLCQEFLDGFGRRARQWPVAGEWPSDKELRDDLMRPLWQMRFALARMVILGQRQENEDLKGSVRNYYEILGIDKDATEEEIRKAWRAFARENHPDTKKPEEKAAADKAFKEGNEAHFVLSDEARKREYDLKLEQAKRGEDIDWEELGGMMARWRHMAEAHVFRSRAETFYELFEERPKVYASADSPKALAEQLLDWIYPAGKRFWAFVDFQPLIEADGAWDSQGKFIGSTPDWRQAERSRMPTSPPVPKGLLYRFRVATKHVDVISRSEINRPPSKRQDVYTTLDLIEQHTEPGVSILVALIHNEPRLPDRGRSDTKEGRVQGTMDKLLDFTGQPADYRYSPCDVEGLDYRQAALVWRFEADDVPETPAAQRAVQTRPDITMVTEGQDSAWASLRRWLSRYNARVMLGEQHEDYGSKPAITEAAELLRQWFAEEDFRQWAVELRENWPIPKLDIARGSYDIGSRKYQPWLYFELKKTADGSDAERGQQRLWLLARIETEQGNVQIEELMIRGSSGIRSFDFVPLNEVVPQGAATYFADEITRTISPHTESLSGRLENLQAWDSDDSQAPDRNFDIFCALARIFTPDTGLWQMLMGPEKAEGWRLCSLQRLDNKPLPDKLPQNSEEASQMSGAILEQWKPEADILRIQLVSTNALERHPILISALRLLPAEATPCIAILNSETDAGTAITSELEGLPFIMDSDPLQLFRSLPPAVFRIQFYGTLEEAAELQQLCDENHIDADITPMPLRDVSPDELWNFFEQLRADLTGVEVAELTTEDQIAARTLAECLKILHFAAQAAATRQDEHPQFDDNSRQLREAL